MIKSGHMTKTSGDRHYIGPDVYLIWDERKSLYKKFKETEGKNDKHIGWEPKDYFNEERTKSKR